MSDVLLVATVALLALVIGYLAGYETGVTIAGRNL